VSVTLKAMIVTQYHLHMCYYYYFFLEWAIICPEKP